jgi:hypothetical protein
MNHVCPEIAVYTRACEGLLSKEGRLTEDERSLLEYYVHELSRELLSEDGLCLSEQPAIASDMSKRGGLS